MKVELGDKVKDPISGWEGIATAYYTYLNGCVRWEISGANDKNEPEGYVFDVQQLVVLEKGAVPSFDSMTHESEESKVAEFLFKRPWLGRTSEARTGGDRSNRPVDR